MIITKFLWSTPSFLSCLSSRWSWSKVCKGKARPTGGVGVAFHRSVVRLAMVFLSSAICWLCTWRICVLRDTCDFSSIIWAINALSKHEHCHSTQIKIVQYSGTQRLGKFRLNEYIIVSALLYTIKIVFSLMNLISQHFTNTIHQLGWVTPKHKSFNCNTIILYHALITVTKPNVPSVMPINLDQPFYSR